MPDPVGPEHLDGRPDRGGVIGLPGMRHRSQPGLLDRAEHLLVELGRVLALRPAETHSDDAAAGVRDRVRDRLARRLGREAAHDVGCEPDHDAVLLPGLLNAIAVAGEHLLVGDAPGGRLGRGEDAFQVDRPVTGRLGRVVGHNLAEVALGPQRPGGHPPHLQEMREVAEPVDLLQLAGRGGGQRDTVALAISSSVAGRTVPSRWTCSSIFGNRAPLRLSVVGKVTPPILAARRNRLPLRCVRSA